MYAIYLIIDKNNQLAKVGHTDNLKQRIKLYSGSNPKAYIRDYVYTYAKTGTSLEHKIRAEMESLGGQRQRSMIDNSRTEWVDFSLCPEVLQSLIDTGLQCM